MENELDTGAILIEEDELLPEALRRQSRPYSKVWRVVKNSDPHSFGRGIEQTGWTFFYTEGEIRATGIGFGGESTIRRTVNHLIGKLKWDKFNCLEIKRVEVKSVFGLSMVKLTACWRLLGPSLAMTPEMSLPSARLLQKRQAFVTQESSWAA